MSSLAAPNANGNAGSSSNTSSSQTTRDAFNAALRSRNPQNNYIAHLKIWEPVETDNGAPPPTGPSRKARYLILAVQRDTGRVTVNKAKRNANGSFSIGKDWDLNALKVVEVIDPTTFSLTLSRPYQWTTDRGREQYLFLCSLVNVYRRYTRSTSGPRCIGITVETQTGTTSSDRAAAPTAPEEKQPPVNARDATASSPPRTTTHFAPPPALNVTQANQSLPGSLEPATAPGPSRPPRGQEPRRQATTPSDNAVELPASAPYHTPTSSDLLSPPVRRPTMQRETSAGAVLERTPSSSSVMSDKRSAALSTLDTDKPSSVSMSRSRSFQSSASSPSVKDTLSDRLARAASGANSGVSTPRPSTPNSAPFSRSSPPRTRAIPPASAPPHKMIVAEEETSSPSPIKPELDRRLSIASTNNARARLSAIEPLARGGKAYEKILLAGTGLRSIGDDDEEDDDEEEEEELADDTVQEARSREAEASQPPLQLQPVVRKKTLKSSRSLSRKATRRQATALADQTTAHGATEDGDSDEDDATLVNVEELLEGIDFRAVHKDPGRLGLGTLGLGTGVGGAYSGILGRQAQGTADVIEANLLSELEALDSANIHSILNGDDRLASVLKHVDAALAQLDSIDSLVASFKMSLNSRADDISFIEGQNRGLQVMNSNWRALQREIEQLRQTVSVPQEMVTTLLDGTYHLEGAIESKEVAAASLYKAILQAKTSQMEETNNATAVNGGGAAGGMAATTERLDEYSSISHTFGTKTLTHLQAVFSELTSVMLRDPNRKAMLQPPRPKLLAHEMVEQALNGYCGLMLYLKEVEPKTFERISAAYLTSAADRYKAECSRYAGVWKVLVRKATEEEDTLATFTHDAHLGGGVGGAVGSINALSRAATVRRLGTGPTPKKSKLTSAEGEVSGAEAFANLLFAIIPLLLKETLFLSDFLHLNSNGLTFADYMDLETYFRRRAAALFGEDLKERRGGLREMKGAMELVFGFLGPEVTSFFEEVEKRDRFQIIGIVGAIDAALLEAEGSGNDFVMKMLSKLHGKATSILDRFFSDQLKAVTASASKQQLFSAPSFRGKKGGRGGLTTAVKVAPYFVDRIEGQIVNAQHLNVRNVVDGFYSRLETTLIDSLLSLKVEATTTTAGGQDEDKGAMNHQVLLIENMHHLVQETSKLLPKAPTLRPLILRSEKVYEESLNHYTHFVLRRPLGRMMDFSDGIESLLRSTPANEVSLHSAYSRSAFKKLVKEHTLKDLRKQVEALWRRVLKHFHEDENESFSLLPAFSSSSSAGVNGGGGDTGHSGSADTPIGSIGEEEERKIVIGKVWRRCETDFVREIERMIRIQDDCYKTSLGGSGAGLEVKVEEVVRLFAR